MSQHKPTTSTMQEFFKHFPALAAAFLIVIGGLKYLPEITHGTMMFYVLLILALGILIMMLYSPRYRVLAVIIIASGLAYVCIGDFNTDPTSGDFPIEIGPNGVKITLEFEQPTAHRVAAYLTAPDGTLYPAPIPLGQVTNAGKNTFFLNFSQLPRDFQQGQFHGKVQVRIFSYNASGDEYVHGEFTLDA